MMSVYSDIVEGFGLLKGDRIWLSSEIIKLAILFKKKGLKFDGNKLIYAFQEKIGKNGTILIPTFSFVFSSHQYYDILHTKGTTGALGNLALEREDFIRTEHPMHSFEIWGKDAEELASMHNKHSFGMDSPFGYCLGKHVKQVILGTDYVHAVTFIHYAEAICNVPYRFPKSFTGTYVNRNGAEELRTYDYAARKLEMEPVEQFNRMGKILENLGISVRHNIFDLECYTIDLAQSFPEICKDIIYNQCANLYDFKVPRELIFAQ